MERSLPPVTRWADAVMVALASALAEFMAFIPKLIGALVILLIGWIISRIAFTLVTRGLRLIRFNQIADRAEVDQFLINAGVRMDPAAVVGTLVYWFLMLIFVVAAFGAFGLPQVTVVLDRIIGFIPNVVVALVVLLLGALAGNLVANLVRGATGTAKLGDPDLLATLARSAILVFAVLVALDQLQIAPAIITTLWLALIGMVAVAGALAFGLGGRDLAKRLLEDWYARSSSAAAQIREAERKPARPTTPDSTASGPPVVTTTTPATSPPPPSGGRRAA